MAQEVEVLTARRQTKWSIRYRTLHLSGRGLLYSLTIALSVMFMFPFFWTISSSLKTEEEWFIFPPTILPAVPQWVNYGKVMEEIPYGRWFMNTAVIAILGTSGALLSSSLVAYSFARFDYRGRDILFIITLSTMMLPSYVTLIPQFILFHKLKWINTIKPLWVPAWFGGGAFNIFLIRQFIMSLPRELDEAALIDGASYFRVFWNILVPLMKPALATVMIISFMGHWSDFMGPLIYLNSPEKFTLSVGLHFFNSVPMAEYKTFYRLLMAASVMTVIPSLVVFFAGQKYFVRGIALSGIKG